MFTDYVCFSRLHNMSHTVDAFMTEHSDAYKFGGEFENATFNVQALLLKQARSKSRFDCFASDIRLDGLFYRGPEICQFFTLIIEICHLSNYELTMSICRIQELVLSSVNFKKCNLSQFSNLRNSHVALSILGIMTPFYGSYEFNISYCN